MFPRGRSDSSTAYADLLATGARWLLVLCACWAVVLVLAATLEVLSRGRLAATSWVGTPPPLRRFLLAALGLALAGVPGVAGATANSPGGLRLPVPQRPTGVLLHRVVRLPVPDQAARVVVVGPGDSLWHLATGLLGRRAPYADVAALVERLHHRNRGVIGPDADLLRPGQRLVVPPLPHRPSAHHLHRQLEETP